jgi:class 3 adenylate cyclase
MISTAMSRTKVRETLLRALRNERILRPRLVRSLKERLDPDSTELVAQAARALHPVIERAARERPSRLAELSLRGAEALGSLAVETPQGLESISAARKVGLVFVDIAGFTSFTATRGDGAAIELLVRLGEHVDRVVALGKGALVKSLGDGFLLAFPSPSQAVRAAVALQEDVTTRGHREPYRDMTLRIAVHCGTPIFENGDLIGHDVNLTARLLEHAAPGDVVVTQPASYAAGRRLRTVRFEPKGIVQIRDTGEAVPVLLARRVRLDRSATS